MTLSSIVTVGDQMTGHVGHHAGHVDHYETDSDGDRIPIYCSGHQVSGQQTTGQSKVRIQGKPVAVVGDQGTTDCACDGLGYTNIVGSGKVRINGRGVVRKGDSVSIHDQGTGTMTTGSDKVRSA